jgi:hypothetical protein
MMHYEDSAMPSFASSSPLKQRAHALIDQLPEDATWRDMVEALAVVEDIEAGLAEGDTGLGVDTATLRKRFGLPE